MQGTKKMHVSFSDFIIFIKVQKTLEREFLVTNVAKKSTDPCQNSLVKGLKKAGAGPPKEGVGKERILVKGEVQGTLLDQDRRAERAT